MRRTRLQKAAAMVHACHSAIFLTSENTYPPLARQREEDLERAWAEYRAAEAEEAGNHQATL